MATNRTRVYSPDDFLQRQSSDTALRPYTLIGITRETTEKDRISFALDVARDNWLAIPVELVESVEVIGTVTTDGDSHPKVSLQLKDPQSPEGQIFAAVATTMEHTLLSVMRNVMPALASAGSAGARDDACHDCIHQCSHVVVTEEDPFAAILCMLSCPCPG